VYTRNSSSGGGQGRRSRPLLRHKALAGLVLALALLLPVGLNAASAATTGVTFTVTSTTDAIDVNLGNGICATAAGACTLRAAIQQANAVAGADVVQVPAGTYTLAIRPQNQNLAETGDLDVTGPLTIVGAGPQSTIVDGGAPVSSAPEIRGLDRLFEIHAGAGDVSIAGLTIREGYSAEQGGAIHNTTAGLLRLQDAVVLDSYAAKYGGGIANAAAGRIELVRSTMSGNGAKEGGSAIHNAVSGTISITAASAIVENPGASLAHYPVTGGAINNEGEGDTIGTIEVLDSTIARNEATSNGAGIYNERDGRVVVLRSTITGNRTSASGAGIYSNSGTVLIREGTTLSDNHAGNLISSGHGGAVYNAGQMSKAGTPGRLEVANATITANTATGDGAGIFCGLDADLAVTDSTISDNEAGDEGGGINTQSKADMNVKRVTFTGNSAGVAGGGAYAYSEGAANFTDTLFTGNSAGETGGGGLFTDGSGTSTVVRSTFVENSSVGDGGGIAIHGSGAQSISDSVVRGNLTDEGGAGIFNSGMLVTFLRLTIADNRALLDGGGIRSEGSSQLEIVDTTVSGNSAENGGGFANAADGTLLLSGSTLSGNEARTDGGGLLNVSDAVSEVLNSTLSGNSAGGRGGGLYTDGDAELDVFNATITDNSAPAGSGLSTSVESINFPVVPATAVFLRNTIVAANRGGTNCHGAVFSQGGNLDEGTTCFFQDPRDLTRIGAGLQPLAANGGATLTHALKPSSVAVDRGVNPCPVVDQRGVARPQNEACDIGAYEFEGMPEAPDGDPLPPPTGPDSEPPTATIDQKPAVRTLDTSAAFAFRADELAVYECVIDPATGASFSGCESPHDYTNLALGLHTFQVRATDASRNVGQPATYTWRIVEELVPPETTIDSGPIGLTRATGGSISFSANEPASFECSLDGATLAACVSPVTVAGLADGTHTFEVRATDSSFNPDESPASRTWTVDTTPPETTVGAGPSGLTNDATPTFTFSSEPGTTFACRVDAAPFAACGSPLTTALLGEGAHTFEVQATDEAGNVDSTPASRSFTVDTIAPETSIDGGPNGLTNDSTPTFSVTADESAVSFECRVDTAAFAPCTSSHTTASLTEGVHTFEARAADAAGNSDGSPASRSFTVDTTAPETTIDSGPDGLTKATSASFAFSSEPAAIFACSLDGGELAPCDSPQPFDALGDGPHTFEVRATDTAGNTDPTPASRAWTVDTTPPATQIDSGPKALGNDATPAFTFGSEDGASLECTLGAGFAACASPFDVVNPLADGDYVFEARATDAAGNTGEAASFAFTVDTQAPLASIDSGPGALTNDPKPSFTFSSEVGARFDCALASDFAPCSSPYSTAPLADGDYRFEVRATDAAGNEGATASLAFTVDTQGPQVTIAVAPAALSNDATPSFEFTSEAGASFACALGGELGACTSPYMVLEPLPDGAYGFEVVAMDAAGNTGETASASFTVDTVGPELQLAGPSGLTNDSTPTFEFTSEAGASFACALDGGLAGCESPYPVKTPLADGDYLFRVQATDLAGNRGEVASLAFTVDTVAPTVELDGPSLTNDSTPSFAFGSEHGASFECALGGDFADCGSPYQVATALADGTHVLRARATDAAGNTGDPASLTFVVDTQGPSVSIGSGPSGPSGDNTPSFTFSSESGATFACAIAGAFAACVSPYAVATPLADGPYTFQVQATDAAGNTGTFAIRAFTVDTEGPTTTIEDGPADPTPERSATFAFTATEDVLRFECRLDSTNDAAFAACTSGVGYPGPLALGDHAFDVRAVDAVGNVGAAARHEWTIVPPPDTTAPETTIDSGPTGVTGDSTPTFAFSSEAGATFECRVGSGGFASCTSPHTTAALADGDQVFEVRARDAAGNVDASPASRAFTVDATAPDTVITAGPSGPTNDTTPTFAFSSEAGATFECRVDTASFATCTSPQTTSPLDGGSHTFEVRARDGAGNSDPSPASRSFAIDTSDPSITLSGPPPETSATTARLVFSAGEAVTGFRCGLDGATPATCTSPVDLTGLGLGEHTFRVEATDPAGNTGTAAHSWRVVQPPDTTPPVVTLSGPTSGTQATSATFTFSANETVTFACALDTPTFSACPSSSPVTYTGLQPGPRQFRVRATDIAGNQAIATWSWTIAAPPPNDTTPPVISLSGPQTGTQATSATFTFSANETVTFACALDTPTFSTCPSSSPVTYTGLQPGPRQFRVRATDTAGNQAIATWNWTIVAPGSCTGGGTVTLGANADTWVLQSSATSSYGADSAIKVDTKSGANARVLLRFALPAIPSGCQVVSARLRLYAASYKTGRTLEALALASSWSENAATWSNQPATTGSPVATSSGSGYREWTVTSLYGQAANGFLIRDAAENGQGVEQAFNSREKSSDNPPQLIVTIG
jgi:CSLREA domain-containing protein